MPWKNGLGETLEILASEDHIGKRFRISQAAVQKDGLFSQFKGMHRTLVMLSGKGVELSHQKNALVSVQQKLNESLDMAHFAGDDETDAKLISGPIEDLNIMVRETDTRSRVTSCFAPDKVSLSSDSDMLLHAFYANQACWLFLNTSENLQLLSQSLVILKEVQQVHLIRGSGVLIKILKA